MEEKYLQELFRLSCVHSNFPGGVAGLFKMEPTDDGQKNLDSYGLYFKEKEDGFLIAAPYVIDNYGHRLEHQFDINVKLSFAIFTTDKKFFNYSELPFDTPGKYVYYFNNLDATKRRTYLLTEVEGIRETERVLLHTKIFSFDYIPNIEAIVYDCRGFEIPATEYDVSIDTIKNQYLLDLSRREDGLYIVSYNGVATEYYCTKASFIRRIPLIIVEFFVDISVPEKYQIVEWYEGIQYINTKKFSFHFGIYNMYWRYKIIPVQIPHSVWIKVKAGNENYTFSPEKARVSCSGDPLVFTSDQVINISNDEVQPALYQVFWRDECLWIPKYYYCDGNYGIYIDGVYKCRRFRYEHGEKVYPWDCPVKWEDEHIGALPKPNQVPTDFYSEDDKYYAEMSLHLIKCNGDYCIEETW